MRVPSVVCLAALLACLGLLAAGCGKTTTTTTNASGQTVTTCHVTLAKTKFVLHAGVAAGAFYRYIYNPYRAGKLKKGAPGRKAALAKAAASALVVTHELKTAATDAQCDGPALKKLASPISSVLDSVALIKDIATGGGLGSIVTAGTAFDALRKAAAAAGAAIKTS